MATMWMGVLALEPVAGALPQRQQLTRATAEGLNAAMGAQLARFLPPEHEYGFFWSAAIYDPAQLLRRGFPLYQELANLFVAGQRHGVDAGQCLTLCELDGRMPTALLEPESAIGGGTLYVIPIAVTGSEQAIAAVSEQLEHVSRQVGDVIERLVAGADVPGTRVDGDARAADGRRVVRHLGQFRVLPGEAQTRQRHGGPPAGDRHNAIVG